MRPILYAAIALPALLGGPAHAQDYPQKPVRFIVGFSPGGGSDILARLLSDKLTESWGRPFVVDNRSGAGGTIALSLTANAAPDGYTVMMISGSQITNAMLMTKMSIDVLKAYAPVTQATSQPYILVVHPSVAAKNVKELIVLAKSKPDALNYASSGTGSFAHLGMELFKVMTGTEMVHIPFKGSGAAMIDLLGGQVQLALTSAISGMPHLKTGKLRGLAVTTLKRSPVIPEFPTVAESGVPGYSVDGWYAVVLPARTPAAIVSKLNRELVRLLDTPAVVEALARDGAVPAPSTPAQLAETMRAELAKWDKVVKSAGLKIE
ncbi:MAG TPA: tripartite tricarboxylate transporter substrate binding protein [Burkholderiales bacterium]|nr:tripartite tricarboxylate transporter substrate binding protein [Burkholderiales bacterium]